MDLTGQRFGKLTVMEKTDLRKNRAVLWKCQCDCGKLAYKSTGDLNNGNARSCGCAWRQSTVHTGDRFGRLTVLRPTQKRRSTNMVWECQCDCGNTLMVRTTTLTAGHSTSCGCLKKEIDSRRDFKKLLTYEQDTCIEFARKIDKPMASTSPVTGVRGVILKKDGRYRAQITFQKVRHNLGCYQTLEDAIEARRKAEALVQDWLKEYDQNQASACPVFKQNERSPSLK